MPEYGKIRGVIRRHSGVTETAETDFRDFIFPFVDLGKYT